MSDPATAKLLELMVPGFLHGMGNALFAIQAQAQVLSLTGKGDADEILTTCGNANAVLDLLRLLAEGVEPGAPARAEPGVAAGSALRAILDPMRIGLRDSRVTIKVSDATYVSTESVPYGVFARAVALAAAELIARVPTGIRGELRMSWDAPRVLRTAFHVDRGQLPFKADLAPAERSVAAALVDAGGHVARVDGGLVMTFPAGDRR